MEPADLDPDDGALIVFTSGTTGEPRGALHPQRYLAGQRAQAEHWLGAREGELVWCTTAPGWSKSARNAFVAPWLCGAAALIHDARFDPAERLELIEREQRQRALPGADRVPDARRPRSASAPSRPAPHGLGRRAAQPGGDRGLPGGARPRDLRRLRPDRDRAPDREPGRRGGPRRLDGQAAAGAPGSDRRRRAAGPRLELPDLLQPLPGRRAVRGRVVADRRPGQRGRRRLPLVRGAPRRPDPLRRLSHRPVRGRVGAAVSPRRGRGGRGLRPRPRAGRRGAGNRRPARGASRATTSCGSFRSTASGWPPPTSSRASSSSPTGCRGRRAGRSSGRSCEPRGPPRAGSRCDALRWPRSRASSWSRCSR